MRRVDWSTLPFEATNAPETDLIMAFFKADEAVVAQREAEKARRAAEKAQQQELRERERAAGEQRRQEEAFRRSPAGQARTSFERGDALFQVSFDVQDIKSNVVPMMGAYTMRSASDVSEVLNSISVEGWDLHCMSTTFVNEGEESRDKFMSSGQNVAVRGRIVGTYVFLRRGGHAPASPQDSTPNNANHR